MKTYLNFITFKAKTCTLSVCFLLFYTSCLDKEYKKIDYQESLNQLEKLYKHNITKAYIFLDSISLKNNHDLNKSYYINSREYFKRSEPILSFLEKENFKSLNAPNIIKVHEEDPTDIKINQPIGYQVIEENLFSESMDTMALKRAINITSARLKLIENNSKTILKEYHLLWLIRDALIRITTTGLSNFDSPVLGQSLTESGYALSTLKDILAIYESKFSNKSLYNKWQDELDSSIISLKTDFDTFDRYEYIKTHAHKQLELWNETVKNWQVEFPFEIALSNDFNSLFSENMFNKLHFSDYKSDTTKLEQKIILGKKLFKDVNLSKERNMSCATCHIKEKGFTDGKITFDNRQKRNTPTLSYAAYQQLYFMDARSGSLEGQIVGVVNNHDEFNMSMDSIIERVRKNTKYSFLLDSLYNNERDDFNLRHAIASYVRTLNPFNSKFDNNINGKENTLTKKEKRGFNLFMGKAACATCHFPPLFNGTIPPNFNDTELEIIGVPKTKENKNLDDDYGRYHLFNVEERKGSFKTPTVRNIAITNPYMHNGVYNTLEEVMDFYNEGGGAGLGFDLPHQTLPFDNLNLSESEIESIIAFMKTLTDNY